MSDISQEIKWMNFNSNSDTHCLCSDTKSSDLNIILNSLNSDDSNFIPTDLITNTTHHNFKFYDIHDFHKLKLSDCQNKFNILHTNICSLNSNFEDLQILLNNLNHEIDIISLNEIWNS